MAKANEAKAIEAKAIEDKYLGNGFLALLVKHPITGDETESLLPISGYTQNKPGMGKFVADLSNGQISKSAHGDKSPEDIALFIFADLVKDKGSDYVTGYLQHGDKAIAKAKQEAKLATWRDKLDSQAFAEHMAMGKSLFAEHEALLAQMADLDARITDAKAQVAKALDIDPTFDLAHVSNGWYVASKTATKGSRQSVDYDYSADTYEQNGKSINGTKVQTSAQVTSRDDDGNITGAVVKYVAKGKTYKGTGDTLHAAHQEARTACMAVIFADAKSTNVNTPDWFDVPVKKIS